MPHVITERNPKRFLHWFARQFAKKNPTFHVDDASFAAVGDSHPDLVGIPSILSDTLLERAQVAAGARLTFIEHTVRLTVGA